MVLVEFFDSEPMNNMIGCLSVNPQKVYFVGESKLIRNQANLYRDFLVKHNISAELIVKPVNKNDLTDILNTISEIVISHQECCFDLTGGDDLLLVAVGMVYEKYKDTKKIYLHRYNLRNNTVSFGCNGEKTVLKEVKPAVTVEQGIALHGGGVSKYYIDGRRIESWKFTPEFITDVDLIWDIAKKNPTLWNSQVGMLSDTEILKNSTKNPLKFEIGLNNYEKISKLSGLLMDLQDKGVVSGLKSKNGFLSFEYKNSQIKRCLMKVGNILELKTILTARRIINDDGSTFFTDSAMQVCIDWDGKIHNRQESFKDTENEIDVVLMKNLIPIFISCKNGYVDDEELYKLNTVASRFGGKYAKKVLVATHLGKRGESAKYFCQRAADMNIILIYNVHTMSDDEFQRRLRNIVL